MTASVLTCANPSSTCLSNSRLNQPLVLRVVTGKPNSTLEMAAPPTQVNHIVSSAFLPTGAVSRAHTLSPMSGQQFGSAGSAQTIPRRGLVSYQALPSQATHNISAAHPGVSAQIQSLNAGTSLPCRSESSIKAGNDQSQSESENERDAPVQGEKDFQHTPYDPTLVKHRRRTTVAQLEILDAHFAESPKPDMDTRRFLSKQLGMTVREVQVWFQNRRAKQKKIDSRAQKTAEGKTSPSRPPVIPFIEPALLNAPQQLSTSSFGSSTSLSEGSGPSVPPFGPSSGYSTAYTPSSISSHYSDVPEVQQTLQYEPHFVGNGNNMPYFPVVAPLVPQDSYPPYQYNSYFPDVKPAYGQTSFAHQSQQQGENAFWESTVHTTAPNVSLGGQDAWGLRQARPLASALDGLNTSVSVSPVSSKNSSLDETALAPRTRNAMPPALSNLGGLSIVPYTDDIVSQEPVYDLSGLPATYSDSPAAAALVMAGPPVQRVPNNTPFLAPYPSNVGYGITPYDGTVVPDRSIPSPMAPALPPTSAGPPALLPAAAVNTVEGPVPYSYPWAPQIPIADGTVRPSSLQVVQHPGLLQNNFMSSAPTNMSQINTALSARRQSLHAYPGDKDFSTVASLQNQRQQGPPASLPKGFSMLDDSGIPIRRASTSAINSIAPIPKIQPVSEPGPLDPQRQAVLDSAAQAVLPLVASPPLVSDTQIFSKPTSPARHRSEGGIPSTPSASTTTHAKFEDTPILGGLRKGSISKKLKSPSNTYSPYPQEHPRHTNGQVKHR